MLSRSIVALGSSQFCVCARDRGVSKMSFSNKRGAVCRCEFLSVSPCFLPKLPKCFVGGKSLGNWGSAGILDGDDARKTKNQKYSKTPRQHDKRPGALSCEWTVIRLRLLYSSKHKVDLSFLLSSIRGNLVGRTAKREPLLADASVDALTERRPSVACEARTSCSPPPRSAPTSADVRSACRCRLFSFLTQRGNF